MDSSVPARHSRKIRQSSTMSTRPLPSASSASFAHRARAVRQGVRRIRGGRPGDRPPSPAGAAGGSTSHPDHGSTRCAGCPGRVRPIRLASKILRMMARHPVDADRVVDAPEAPDSKRHRFTIGPVRPCRTWAVGTIFVPVRALGPRPTNRAGSGPMMFGTPPD
jgi:hypothetical protein